MNKTMKKILLALVLFIAIILLKSTNSFGYVTNSDEAFKMFTNKKFKSEYTLYLGEKMYSTDTQISWYLKPTIKIDNLKIVGIENKDELKAKKIGSTNVTVTLTNNGKTVTKKFKINVVQSKANTKLESKINDVTLITQDSNAKNKVLLANSELWNAKDKTYKLTNKSTGNVAQYVYSCVYRGNIMVTAILKKDNNLTYQYPKMEKKTNTYKSGTTTYSYDYYVAGKTIKTQKVSKVKEIFDYGYLTNSGKLYFYQTNKKNQLETKKIASNVKKILSNYIYTKKGATYAISGKKITDFEAVEVDKSNSCYSGLLLDKKGKLYYYYYDNGYEYKNGKYAKVKKEGYIVKKVATNVKTIIGNYKYQTKDGKTKQFDNNGQWSYTGQDNSIVKTVWLAENNRVVLKNNNKVYLNSQYIINKVDDIYDANGTKGKSALIVRKDGSIWRLDIGGKANLTKIRSGKIDKKKISKPTNLKASKSGKNNVKVKWSKVEGAKKYTIYRATTKNGKYKKVATSKTNSYKDTKLKKGQKYYYKVVANYSDSTYDSNMSSAVKIKLAK